jgi:hypothetical protein
MKERTIDVLFFVASALWIAACVYTIVVTK